MVDKKRNIHGVIIYSKDPNYRNQFNQYIASCRTKDNFADFYNPQLKVIGFARGTNFLFPKLFNDPKVIVYD